MAEITDLDIELDGSLTTETPIGTVVGRVVPTGGTDPFTFDLKEDEGFDIDVDEGEVTTTAKLEPGDHTITVSADDADGDTLEQQFILTVAEATGAQSGTANPDTETQGDPQIQAAFEAEKPPPAPGSELVLDAGSRPADPDITDGFPKYPNFNDPVLQPRVDPNSSPTSPIFIYDTPEREDRRLEKPETIRSPTWAEQAAFGAPGITISGKHQDDGKDYVQAGGNPGQIGHGMVLGKAGEKDITAPAHPHDLAPQTEVPESTADASKLPDQNDPDRPTAPENAEADPFATDANVSPR